MRRRAPACGNEGASGDETRGKSGDKARVWSCSRLPERNWRNKPSEHYMGHGDDIHVIQRSAYTQPLQLSLCGRWNVA